MGREPLGGIANPSPLLGLGEKIQNGCGKAIGLVRNHDLLARLVGHPLRTLGGGDTGLSSRKVLQKLEPSAPSGEDRAEGEIRCGDVAGEIPNSSWVDNGGMAVVGRGIQTCDNNSHIGMHLQHTWQKLFGDESNRFCVGPIVQRAVEEQERHIRINAVGEADRSTPWVLVAAEVHAVGNHRDAVTGYPSLLHSNAVVCTHSNDLVHPL